MGELKKLDPVAYVRFASVYRDFQDMREFMAELEEIQGQAAEVAAKKRRRPRRQKPRVKAKRSVKRP